MRIPPVRTSQPKTPAGSQRFEWVAGRTLYEDEHIIVLNKPGGLAVHGGTGVHVGLIEGLRQLRPDLPMLELVHRLDRDTSGCLLLAKDRVALVRLHDMLRQSAVDKRYLALVKGRWRGGSRQISAPLARDRVRGGERLVGVSEAGRTAESQFEPKGSYGPATLMEIRLHTGRTHQARVHAAHAGHPIAGDEKYGDREFNRELRELGLRKRRSCRSKPSRRSSRRTVNRVVPRYSIGTARSWIRPRKSCIASRQLRATLVLHRRRTQLFVISLVSAWSTRSI